MKKLFLWAVLTSLAGSICAQLSTAEANNQALQHIRSNHSSFELTANDVRELRVTDSYRTAHLDVTHVYLIQQYNGVDVDETAFSVHIKDGDVVRTTNGLIPELQQYMQASSANLDAENAVSKALSHLDVQVRGALVRNNASERKGTVFHAGAHAAQDITANPIYTRNADGQYELTWSVVAEPFGQDIWDVRVSAETGEVIKKLNLTLHCSFPDNFLGHQDACGETHVHRTTSSPLPVASDGPVYNVIPIPFESPKHGDRRLVTDPSDPEASPYGWHDLDGEPGSDTTITYGNNVLSMLDRDGNYEPDQPYTSGGTAMNFDFAFDQNAEPIEYVDASVTNLFYMNNVMHDFAYAYGFDEVSGNFQQVNYSATGAGTDPVMAHSQFGGGVAPNLNNATFGTPNDGGSGRMRMFLWEAGGSELLTVDAPASIAGKYASSTTTDWGGLITAEPVTGEVVIVDDGSGNPSQGCNALENGADLQGKIALIDRGNCEFGTKALNAEEAGAIGFIICNFQEGLVNMGAGADGAQVTIPGVFIGNSDCQRIRAFVGEGLTVSLVNEAAGEGPTRRTGSFDNGVIAHEYGHGISNRLTGGPNRSGCLVNYDTNGDDQSEGEQMGEGWSDFFTLVTTVKASDTGDRPRGIGTYADGQDTTGGGIRPFPYTTDMSINPMTYNDVPFYSVPHGVGSVWCTMLWDMYWALTDKYGFDEDLYHGDGGNNLAVQLVMDGMKFQPCNPGFVEGRNAILFADTLLTGAENSELIWQVFARRGLGWSADEGDQASHVDGTVAFDMPPGAVKELKITKEMSSIVDPGQDIEVTLTISNDKTDDATGIVVTDAVPEGASFVSSSSNIPAEIQGDNLVFEPADLAAGESMVITYRLSTSPSLGSESIFFDDMENGDFNWNVFIDEGAQFWTLIDFNAYSGDYTWAVPDPESESDQSLFNIDPIELPEQMPMVRFFNRFNTEKYFDAGVLMITNDDGFTWNVVPSDKIVRGGHTGRVQFGLFAIPNMTAWYGDSDGWQETLVDLSDYAGETVQLRWRFGADAEVAGEAWYIDDVEIMDAFQYNSTVCVTSAEDDEACAEAADWGTLVSTAEVSSAEDFTKGELGSRVFPNPTRDIIYLDLRTESPSDVNVSVMNNTGQLVASRKSFVADSERMTLSARQWPAGMYFIHIVTEKDQQVHKIIVE